jgi:hypothetical protein
MKRRATIRRGFATATALTLLAFVAVLLAAMGTSIGIEARRTRHAAVEAQLRQLLLAGAAAAGEETAAAGTASVSLPSHLTDDMASLTITMAMPSPGERTATIDASIAARHARQVVRFALRDGRWDLVSASIDSE